MNKGIELPLSVPGDGLTWVSLVDIQAVFPVANVPYAPSFQIMLRGYAEPIMVMFQRYEGSTTQQWADTKNLRTKLIAALQGETET